MKNIFIKFLILFLISSSSKALADNYSEILKLYNLFSKEILDKKQLEASLKKINLDKEEIKDLFYLREQDIISKEDFNQGIKKVLEKNSSVLKIDNKDNSSDLDYNLDFNREYFFETKVTKLSQYVLGEFKNGDVWNNKFIFENDKIVSIRMNNQNESILKFLKPRTKILRNNNFSVKSNIIYLKEPSVPILYLFKGKIEEGKVKGKIEISYNGGSELSPGTIIITAETD